MATPPTKKLVDDLNEEKLYSVPMVQPPSLRELEVISDQLGLGITETSSLQTYKTTIDGIIAEINKIEDEVEVCLPVKYPRTPGYRPSRSENPYNAWYYKSEVCGASGGSGILSGKSVVLKDTIPLAGVPMSVGSHVVEGFVPDFDASVVTKVLDAGAKIVGKATCEDLCFSGESFTSATGPVLNPVNTKHSAGGSSSGCAVLVQNGEVDMAIGGDQGGSVRIPASYCGIVGLKPTYGLVPYTGVFSLEHTVDHLGPMTRTVEDCALLLQAMAGYDDGNDPRQPSCLQVPSYSSELETIPNRSELRIGVLLQGFGHPESDPKLDGMIRETLAKFATSTAAEVQDVSIPLHKLGNQIAMPINMVGMVDDILTTGGLGMGYKGFYPTHMMKEISTKFRADRGKLERLHKSAFLCGQYLKENYIHVYGKAQNIRNQLTKAYDRVLSEYDVIAMPTIPFTAPPLPRRDPSDAEFDEAFSKMTANTIANDLTGHPSISIPAGTLGGLPVGLMLTGKKFGEVKLLQIAKVFETFLASNAAPK